jgi:hypothetical protein
MTTVLSDNVHVFRGNTVIVMCIYLSQFQSTTRYEWETKLNDFMSNFIVYLSIAAADAWLFSAELSYPLNQIGLTNQNSTYAVKRTLRHHEHLSKMAVFLCKYI